MTPRPPRLATLLVAALVANPDREFVLGDLWEQFSATVSARGRVTAWRRYWSQAVRSAWSARQLRGQARQPRQGGIDLSNLTRDIVRALRAVAAAPAYSVVVIVTTALAIGANTLLFSIANPLVVRPLPIKDQAHVGWVWQQNQANGGDRLPTSIPDFLEWRAATHAFSSLAAFEQRSGTFMHNGDPTRVQLMSVTANFPDTWGLRPVLGRLFEAGDDVPGRTDVAVLAYHYWKSSVFDGDRSVVGRTALLDGLPVRIVGVMEPEIEFGDLAAIDMWVPLPLAPTASRSLRTALVVGRLAPQATLAKADAEISGLAMTQAREHPATNRGWTAHVVSTMTATVGPDTWPLIGLLAVVVFFVLLIACANLANLVLARVVGRRQDLTVRKALGASRLQLVRPLLVENLVLGALGGVVGLGVAATGLRGINAVAYDQLLRTLTIDRNVLVFTAGLSLVTPLLFSFWPALRAWRVDTAEALRESRASSTRQANRGRRMLVISQVALALSLLFTSALIVRSMTAYKQIHIGLDVPHLMTFSIELPAAQYPDGPSEAALADRVVDALAALPGIASVGVTNHLPVFAQDTIRTLSGTRHDGTTEADRPWASAFAVTGDFFSAAGIHLLAGRAFNRGDTASSTPVAVVSRLTAQKYFDGLGTAVGSPIVVHGLDTGDRPVSIVGVVEDTNDSTIVRKSPQIYLPFDQLPAKALTVVLHATDPATKAQAVRTTMRNLEPTLAISDPTTMAATIQTYVGDNRIVIGLFVGFAVLALLLAAAGLYGVIAYSVGQRRREIGVRLALGASPPRIRRMFVNDALKVTGAGVLIGLLLALLMGRAASSALHGVSAHDPFILTAVTLGVLVIALGSVLGPAARAMRVDPVRTLRSE